MQVKFVNRKAGLDWINGLWKKGSGEDQIFFILINLK